MDAMMAGQAPQRGFFAELKRRNVFRVAGAYLVVGWLLVEIASVAFDAFESPGWVIKVFIGFVVLGFPLALFLAWAFELTPDGLVRDQAGAEKPTVDAAPTRAFDYFIVGFVVLAAGFVVIDRFVLQKDSEANVSGASTSVAVLPFVNMSDDDSRNYFSDGISEELLNRLVRIEDLRVASRTSSFAFRDQALSLKEIAARLGVDHVLEGSVRREGDRVRITAQLIDAATDSHLWSNTYDTNLSVADLFDLQTRVASEIAAALQVTLAAGDKLDASAVPTRSMAAYDHFMLGRYHYRRQLPGDLELAVQNFEAAVARDADWAEAWDWLAYAYNHAATQAGHMLPADAYPRARAAALRALEIQPDLATARSILGYIRAVYDWDWVGAEADLRRAVALDPHDSGTVWSLAHVLALLGRHDEAVRLTGDFAALRPDAGRHHREFAARLLDAGRPAEALEALDTALAAGAEAAQTEDYAGVAWYMLGDYTKAAVHLETAVRAQQRAPGVLARLACAYARDGRIDEARAIVEELDRRTGTERVAPVTLATAQIALARYDAALDYLESAADDRDRAVLGIGNDPFLAPLAGNPRFAALIERFGMPAPPQP